MEILRRMATLVGVSLALLLTGAERAYGKVRTGIAREARALVGIPYRWGGESRRGMDCSGLTRWLYARRGIVLPHSARLQARMGRLVSRGRLRAGDLIFFRTRKRGIGHVGIYIGSGRMVHAPRPGRRVTVVPVAAFGRSYAGARRLLASR